MVNTKKIEHAQTLLFTEELDRLKDLVNEKNTKDALSLCVEAFLELKPVKTNGRWVVTK